MVAMAIHQLQTSDLHWVETVEAANHRLRVSGLHWVGMAAAASRLRTALSLARSPSLSDG